MIEGEHKMVTVVGVRFKKAGKVYFFDPEGFQIEKGAQVLVETTRGIELGTVVLENKGIQTTDVVAPLKKVIRIATEEDQRKQEENKKKEKEAFDLCVKKIQKHNLDMKLVDVEYTFDNNKMLFYFTAEGRIDFRELVKDLASVFRTRIELRQIGVRDEAKILGGVGICGIVLCCKAYLGEFQPVSIKMAKEQGLSLNPSKISGVCGRLMCCLKYEQDAYEDALERVPRVGALVKTPHGSGTVVYSSVLKELVKVKLDKGQDLDFVQCKAADVEVIGDAQKPTHDENIDISSLENLED
jgi:cell fate regulator YaaT (PSP1 superfamily)